MNKIRNDTHNTAEECLRTVDHMWGILSNEIADNPAHEVISDVQNAIPTLEQHLNRLKELTTDTKIEPPGYE